MSAVNTLIKWPGGKTRELEKIISFIPSYSRYIEPFFGGGAMFFYLRPEKAIINDISKNLMDFYGLVKEQNSLFHAYLNDYYSLIQGTLAFCEEHYPVVSEIYEQYKSSCSKDELTSAVKSLAEKALLTLPALALDRLCFDSRSFLKELSYNIEDKIIRTAKNESHSPFSDSDLKENLIAGFISGIYMYSRSIHNDMTLKRRPSPCIEYCAANFYFIREYCYGSMFRYNAKGEFNIPYGGMSYNRKSFKSKIDNMFSSDISVLFANTSIYCEDFEALLSSIDLNENDFMFLDPPYDTEFSDYEGNAFTKEDQKRLSEFLKGTVAKFILIIKNTDYIYSLYENCFDIYCFDKTYTYNVRSRNDRCAEHLIITNISASASDTNEFPIRHQ